ncbi:aspartic peptidase domain-containing protein [Mycena filopes]|nr:aspartic peptidase domain-containing protein [Mycena filopes]
MRSALLSLLPVLLLSYESAAVKLTISRPPKSASRSSLRPPKGSANDNLINKENERYTANITISGRVVNVALDTGSTDLWVMPPEGLPSFNDTKLNATCAADAEKPDFDDGIFGLWGLGFNTPGSSGVNDAVQTAFGASQNWGQSVLANIFAANQSGADYIGIALSRTGDTAGTADASLTISEYDSDYQAVANSPKINQNPVNSGAWTVTLDSISVGGKKINWPSTMTEAPAGKNIVHLDTGTTNIMMPAQQVPSTRRFPGAVLSPDSFIPQTKFSTTYDVWVVPCNATYFPLHPLDLTDMQVVTSPDGTQELHDVTSPDGNGHALTCIGTVTDVGTIVQGESDALFGDTFLRNVYTVFDFATGGGSKGTPFVQMLSTTDATKAQADLISVRSALMANMAPEISPLDLVKIFNGTEKAGNQGSSATGGGSSGGKSGGSSGGGSGALTTTPSVALASVMFSLLAVVSFSL